MFSFMVSMRPVYLREMLDLCGKVVGINIYTSPMDTGDYNEEIESIQEFGRLPCKSQTSQGTVDGRNPAPGM